MVRSVVVAWIGFWSFPTSVQAGQNPATEGPWEISEEARLTVGGRGADGHAFADVVDAAYLTDGRLMVADAGALQFSFFSDDGELLRTVGRQGQGPGEFTVIASASACAADSIFVHDPTRIGVSVFAPSGDLVTVRRFAPPGESIGRLEKFACNRSGVDLLVVEDERPDLVGVGPLPRGRWSLILHRPDATENVGRFPSTEEYFDGQGLFGRPFGKRTSVVLGTEFIYVGTAETSAIDVFDLKGRRLGRITDTVPRLPLSSERIERFVDRRVQSLAGSSDEEVTRRYYRDMEFPELLPPYRTLLVDPEDNVWVEMYSEVLGGVRRWRVYDPTGRMLSVVSLPPDFELLEPGANYILGVTTDALGVESVALHSLEKMN